MDELSVRERRYKRAKALKDETGWTWQQVSKHMGVSVAAILEGRHDPKGEKARARKQKYRGVCVDCGGVTCYSGKGSGSLRCRSCHAKHKTAMKKWTRETVVAAIQRFHREHGRRPVSTDWNTPDRDDYAPPLSIVQYVFRSWSDAIEAAGFGHPKVGDKLRPKGQGGDTRYTRRLRKTGVVKWRKGA